MMLIDLGGEICKVFIVYYWLIQWLGAELWCRQSQCTYIDNIKHVIKRCVNNIHIIYIYIYIYVCVTYSCIILTLICDYLSSVFIFFYLKSRQISFAVLFPTPRYHLNNVCMYGRSSPYLWKIRNISRRKYLYIDLSFTMICSKGLIGNITALTHMTDWWQKARSRYLNLCWSSLLLSID